MMNVLDVNRLSKSYGDVKVLDEISFSIDSSGQIVGFLGPNGIGKTTLFEILTGQRPQDEGEVNVLGFELPKDSLDLKYEIGILPEKEAPATFTSAREYLTTFGRKRGMTEKEVEESIEDWGDLLQFTDVLDVLSSDLSRGQQQKVMISQAFLHEPELVFIDEPLANLDPIIQEIFIEKLKEYTYEEGNTVVLSTHQIDFALEVCSELHLLSEETPHRLLEEPDEYSRTEIVQLLGGDIDEI